MRWRVWVGVSAGALLACGADSKSSTDACVPGASQACAGPEACPGFQVCKDDGSGFGACDCSGGAEAGADASTTDSMADGGSDSATDAGVSCEGGLALCAGQCLDTSTDTKNCGTCGHDCLGASCAAGLCNPTTLATGQGAPISIAVNATDVYWTNGAANSNTVMMCGIGGCGNSPTPLASTRVPFGITLDSANAYWVTEDGKIWQCALAGCAGNPTLLAMGQGSPIGVAVSSGSIYWANYQNTNSTIGTCQIAQCASTLTTFFTGVDYTAIVADATSVYWTSGIAPVGVMACPLGGCGGNPTNLGTGQTIQGTFTSASLAVDSTSVYWTNTTDGTVLKCSKAGCATPTILAQGQMKPWAVAVDATSVYWTTYVAPNGAVLKCPLAGCNGSPVTLASGLSYPAAIAVDATSVYWAIPGNSTDGSIMKVAK